MTEFEMASLSKDLADYLATQFSLFFAVLSAFLVASYLAAHRLTLTMVVIGVGFFVIACTTSIICSSAVLASFLALSDQMRRFANTGNGLAWHVVANTPEGVLEITGMSAILLYVLATAAAIYFFFHCRRVNRQAEATGAPAKPAA